MTTIAGAPGGVPAALLPVRLETRFTSAPPQGLPTLQLRIYPSPLLADAHDPRLTVSEAHGGADFWAVPETDEPGRRAAWAALVARHGATRAAWIVRESASPAHPPRDGVWQRAVHAAALPDRWLARGYRGGARVVQADGSAIQAPLALGPDPDPDAPPAAAGQLVDDGLAWAVDWEAAKAAGMALEIRDCPPLDRLVVFGLKAETGDRGAATLAGLLDAHRYGEGLELLAQGTPTNNTRHARAGYTGAAEDATAAYDRLFHGGPVPDDETDGGRLAGALGVPAAQFEWLAGSSGTESQEAQAINAALWPTTWGHTLDLVSDAVVSPAAVEVLRRHFVDWVRARGPLAALRFGRQPLGVLPVLRPARAVGPQDDPALRGIATVLERTRAWFLNSGKRHAAGETEALLERSEVSQADAARAAFTPVDGSGWFEKAESLMDRPRQQVKDLRAAETARVAAARGVLGAAGDLGWPAWILLPEPGGNGPGWPVARSMGPRPRVDAGRPPTAYLTGLAGAERAQLETDGADESRDTLLYLLVRSSLLRVLTGSPPPDDGQPARGRLDGGPEPAPATALAEAYAGVRRLAGLESSERLERLLAETLDLAGHRWDAWATSLATRRLALLRRGGSTGTVVGGFGWVDGLAPAAPPAKTKKHPYDEAVLPLAGEESSWAAAPSLAQAVTAAVLWSGQLRRRRGALSAAVDVDLSSRRVRTGKSVLSAVGAGHRLGEVLGYRLERALQDRAGEYIAPLRRLAPLDLPAGSTDSRDVRAAATDVVDGLALLRRLEGPEGIQWGTGGVPPENDAVKRALADLRDTMDAVADLLLAEGVHQTLQGRSGRTSATLAAAARGELTAGELEFPRSPRTGTAVSHRIIVLVPPGSASGWPSTPRARAEPALDRWAAAVLGPPTRSTGTIELVDPATGAIVPGSARALTLADLGLAPLDVLAVAGRPGELERYLTWWLRSSGRWPQDAPGGAEARLAAGAAPASGERAIVDALALAAAAARVAASARALDGRDLGAGEPAADLGALATRVNEARTRVDAAGERLKTAKSLEQAPRLREALLGAWLLGVRDVLPRDGAPLYELVQQATGAITELDRRVAASLAGVDPGPDDPAGALRIRLERLELLHGEGFRAVPTLTLPDPGLPRRAVAGTSVVPAGAAQAPPAWLARLARVRPPVEALETLGALSEALGTGQPLRLHVGQLPVAPADQPVRWAGLPPLNGTPPQAAASLVFAGEQPPASGALAGLVVDSVDETIPARAETAGVTFRHDAPAAQAPQAILLAVPPVGHGAEWRVEDVEAAVLDAADLACLRLADPAELGALGALLPAVHLPGPTAAPAPGRLIVPPPKFAVADLAQPPGLATLSRTSLMQGETAMVTVTGSLLTGATYGVTGGLVDVVTLSRSATGAVLEVSVREQAVPADDPSAPPRFLQADTLGGSATAPFTVTRAPRVTEVDTTHLDQKVGHDATFDVAITGEALPSFTGADVTGTHVEIGASVLATTAERAVVKLGVRGAPQPSTTWDPNAPGAPRKPPLPPEANWTYVPITLTLTSTMPAMPVELFLGVVSFVDQER